jgi:UDP-N-acetylglucosamine acyltransferase
MIGGPAEFRGNEVQGRVMIGDNNTITGLVSIDSGTSGYTIMTNGCYVMKHAHVGHDAVVEMGVTISCGAKIGGHAVINAFANIGLNAVIHQKQVIAQAVMIGMGAVVTKTLETEPFSIYVGNPAKYFGENVKHPRYSERPNKY